MVVVPLTSSTKGALLNCCHLQVQGSSDEWYCLINVWGKNDYTEQQIFIRCSITCQRCANKILEFRVRLSGGVVELQFLLVEDNGSSNKASLLSEYLEKEGITRLDCPAYSHDFKPD
ncbi:hypothetical protein CEXT_720741 [Caerostris extrusa]|uniref:Uncharacterized protein n=1 Tax=Caerostris extrusa TaxID=172846 RepID=A0AAV4N378_CAEEX|nr:hypothetical protein CEXT_720741 [Caerostris extrusa]